MSSWVKIIFLLIDQALYYNINFYSIVKIKAINYVILILKLFLCKNEGPCIWQEGWSFRANNRFFNELGIREKRKRIEWAQTNWSVRLSLQ